MQGFVGYSQEVIFSLVANGKLFQSFEQESYIIVCTLIFLITLLYKVQGDEGKDWDLEISHWAISVVYGKRQWNLGESQISGDRGKLPDKLWKQR